MGNLSQSITAVCHQLIEKPTNSKVKTSKEYRSVFDEAIGSQEANQELVLDDSKYLFYVHVKNNICIRLYKGLSIGSSFNDMNNDVYEILHEKDQVVQNGNWSYVAMQKGNMELKFNDTTLSKQISENEFMQKNGAILKGDNCFIERVSPGGREGENYALIESTQEDLKAILLGLTELL